MNKSLEVIRKTRNQLLDVVKDLSIEQLNKVPEGFNNNIIWNMGHLVAAQQGICYRRAGVPLLITDDFFELYKPTAKPERLITHEEVAEIIELFYSTLDQFETDHQQGLFANYTPRVTRYGVSINTVDDAVNFLPFHEGLHLGYVMALKRLVTL